MFIGSPTNFLEDFSENVPERNWLFQSFVITTKNDSLSEEDAMYLISSLSDKALATDSLAGNDDTDGAEEIEKYKQAILDEYLDGALFILEFMGVSCFSIQ